MSWQIPQQIEKDIIAGKAQYRTFQTGVGGQSILPVPNNAYAVVFGYDYSPAGGGLIQQNELGQASASTSLVSAVLRFFETQQISFYTGTDFFPFIHHCDIKTTTSVRVIANNVPPTGNIVSNYATFSEINNSPISRQVYITSPKDITITVGLIQTLDANTFGTIPITNRTPALLTYGGSPQTPAEQTDFGPNFAPGVVQFMQPSPKDFQDFGFGLLPSNANGQAFATPDVTDGLLDPSQYLASLGVPIKNAAAANYFLCLHYALYSSTIPEQRG